MVSTKKEETRHRLLDAARELLVARGYQKVSLDDIARAAGVSRQAVYKSHFTSKADLLLALVRHMHVSEQLDELVQPYHAATSGPAMLKEAIRAIVLIEVRVHVLARELSVAAYSDPEARVALQDRLQVKRGAIEGAVARARREGALDPEWTGEEVVDLLLSLLSIDSYEHFVVNECWEPEKLIERVWRICQRSFLRRPLG